MAQKPKQNEKLYSAEEVAAAVLKKAHEMMKSSGLFKANSSHEIEAGEEPNNDDAEAPEYLADADIEDSGAHGEKKSKKKAGNPAEADQDGDGDIDGADAMSLADKDGDGDVDGEDAIEEAEEQTGDDLDGDGEAGEDADHKDKIKAAAKEAEGDDEEESEVKPEDKVKAAAKDEKKPFEKSEKVDKCGDMKPGKTLKKFMLQRKMKKSGGPTADSRLGEKLSGAKPEPTPAAKIKEQPKMQMEKNKETEKLLGIKPKAGK